MTMTARRLPGRKDEGTQKSHELLVLTNLQMPFTYSFAGKALHYLSIDK